MPNAKHPTPPEDLIALQRWFSAAVRVNDPDEELTLRTQSHSFLTASTKQGQNERLSIYMNDYWPRCLESLAEDFPNLFSYMGETQFYDTMRNYVTTCPPQSYTLLFLGRNLPHFLNNHHPEKDRALVCDIATFEWAKIVSFSAENTLELNPSLLSDDQKQHLDAIPLQLHPSVQLLLLNHAVHKSLSPKLKTTNLVVFRQNFEVLSQPIHPLFLKFLTCFETPCSISDAMETVIHSLSKQDIYVLETNIQTWISDAVLQGWFRHPN